MNEIVEKDYSESFKQIGLPQAKLGPHFLFFYLEIYFYRLIETEFKKCFCNETANGA